MKNIASVAELESRIQLLEQEQEITGQLLKEQLLSTYDRLRLVNILKSSVRKTITSPMMLSDLVGTSLGLVTAYLTKKIFIGTSGNIFRKLLGSAVQIGVMSFMSKHSSGMQSIGRHLLSFIIRKRE